MTSNEQLCLGLGACIIALSFVVAYNFLSEPEPVPKFQRPTTQTPPASQEEQDYQEAKRDYEASLASLYHTMKDAYPDSRDTLQDFIQEAYRQMGPRTHEQFVAEWRASKQHQ